MNTFSRILILICSVLLLAACGDEQTDTYVDGFNDAVDSLQEAGTAFEQAEDIASFAAARELLDESIGQFEVLDPPQSVRTEHDSLVDSLEDASASLAYITETSTEEEDEATVDDTLRFLEQASEESDRIRAELE
jgi:hypothetical protein